MYKNNETDEEVNEFVRSTDKSLKIDVNKEDKYYNVRLYKKYDYITPGLNKLFNVDEISIERKIYYES